MVVDMASFSLTRCGTQIPLNSHARPSFSFRTVGIHQYYREVYTSNDLHLDSEHSAPQPPGLGSRKSRAGTSSFQLPSSSSSTLYGNGHHQHPEREVFPSLSR